MCVAPMPRHAPRLDLQPASAVSQRDLLDNQVCQLATMNAIKFVGLWALVYRARQVMAGIGMYEAFIPLLPLQLGD